MLLKGLKKGAYTKCLLKAPTRASLTILQKDSNLSQYHFFADWTINAPRPGNVIYIKIPKIHVAYNSIFDAKIKIFLIYFVSQ